MDDKVNYAWVGAFVLVLGTAFVAGVLWLAAGLDKKRHYERYQSIITESVAGLNVEAPVKYMGVDVGKVSHIEIDPQNSRQVKLELLIEQGTPIKRDSEAVLKTQGLTGIAYVELSGGSAHSPTLVVSDDGVIPMIPSKPSLGARLENVLTHVLANVDRTSANVNAVFDDDNRAALKQTLADISSLAHALAGQQGHLSAGITDAAKTARNLAQATEQLKPVMARVGAGADAIQQMAAAAGQASTQAGRAVDEAASGVRQISTETVPELERLLAEMNQLALSLQRLSDQTTRNPSSLLVGGPRPLPGPGEKAHP